MTETHTDPDHTALDGATTDREADHAAATTSPGQSHDAEMPAIEHAGEVESTQRTEEATQTDRPYEAGATDQEPARSGRLDPEAHLLSDAGGTGAGVDGAGGTTDADEVDGDDADGADDDADEVDGEVVGEDGKPGATKGRRRGGRVSHLEREGEVAADFLETLLDIADLDGDIEVDIEGDRAAVSVVDSDEGRVPRRLVGAQGKVLEALQELTRLAVQTATGERSRLMLDVAGHRAERRTVLVGLARTAIAQVKGSGERMSLDNMTAFERKVVHDEVAASGLDSESEGVEPHRHIVIIPV